MRKGDTGADVRELQQRLGITVDGWFGDSTDAAVRAFQKQVGLVADGIVGGQTMLAMRKGEIDKQHLSHAALVAAAEELEVDVAAVIAITEVECIDRGFLPSGRPKILFERHVMYKRLVLINEDADAMSAKYPNLVNTARGGYMGGDAEHARLVSAKGLNHTCAIESASWGLFQIMGYHWKTLGYASAEAFVTAMESSEDDHLYAFVKFVQADKDLHAALKARKWTEFAKRYNGSAYKENLYDVKLARAYDRHAAAEGVA